MYFDKTNSRFANTVNASVHTLTVQMHPKTEILGLLRLNSKDDRIRLDGNVSKNCFSKTFFNKATARVDGAKFPHTMFPGIKKITTQAFYNINVYYEKTN